MFLFRCTKLQTFGRIIFSKIFENLVIFYHSVLQKESLYLFVSTKAFCADSKIKFFFLIKFQVSSQHCLWAHLIAAESRKLWLKKNTLSFDFEFKILLRWQFIVKILQYQISDQKLKASVFISIISDFFHFAYSL